MTQLANSFVAFLFAASAPVAIILGVGIQGGLSQSDLNSWIFSAFAFNGVLSICASIAFRQPLVFLWSIPGTILVGTALQTLSFDEVIGAYVLTGLLLFLLGITGWIRVVMNWLPMPIVMGMVAGVFIEFCLDWLKSFERDFMLVASMSITFFLVSAIPKLVKGFPPMICAFLVGVLVMLIQGSNVFNNLNDSLIYVTPKTYIPVFSFDAALELVVPLAITVIAAQNAQGIAILRAAGHNPPISFITSACGLLSKLSAIYGSVSTCLTGPVNAILVSSGPRDGHWSAAVLLGFFAIIFGIFSPLVTDFLASTPTAFLITLAGLALLRTLQTAFETSFGPSFPLGGLIAFLVTFSGMTIMNIGAPLWGILFGVFASLLMERQSFTQKL